MTIDTAINKVKKLLDLAAENSGGTEAERDLAMQRAQEIMLKHGLEMSMIADADQDDRQITEERFEVMEEDWRRLLLDQIARGAFARTYFFAGSKRTVIVGRPEQVAFVKELYSFLVPQLEASAIKTMKSYDKRAQYAYLYGLRALTMEIALGQIDMDITEATQDDIAAAGLRRFYVADDRKLGAEDIQGICGIALNYAKEVRPFVKREEIAPGFAQHTGVFMRSFFMSAASTVGARLKATQQRFADEGGDNAMALVRTEDKAVEDFLDNLDLKKSTNENKFDRLGWEHGASEASNFSLNLNREVKGGRKELNA
jgi:hypothetical protein